MTYRQYQRAGYGRPIRRRRSIGGGLLIALIMAGFVVCKYYSNSSINPITNEKQHINMSVEQEIAIGLQSAPTMAQRHGGLHPDRQA